jgi:hypothetical protein
MSKIFTLNFQDAIKSLFVFVIAAVLTTILSALQNGAAINWQEVGIVALMSAISYILKNFVSDQNGNPLGIGTKQQ